MAVHPAAPYAPFNASRRRCGQARTTPARWAASSQTRCGRRSYSRGRLRRVSVSGQVRAADSARCNRAAPGGRTHVLPRTAATKGASAAEGPARSSRAENRPCVHARLNTTCAATAERAGPRCRVKRPRHTRAENQASPSHPRSGTVPRARTVRSSREEHCPAAGAEQVEGIESALVAHSPIRDEGSAASPDASHRPEPHIGRYEPHTGAVRVKRSRVLVLARRAGGYQRAGRDQHPCSPRASEAGMRS